MPDLCEKLKEEREKRNLTQAQMAQLLGLTRSSYSLYESGKREPGVQIIKKMADILEISTDELLGFNSIKIFHGIKAVEKGLEHQTIAAHFDGAEFTEEELEEIRKFAEFIKSRKEKK